MSWDAKRSDFCRKILIERPETSVTNVINALLTASVQKIIVRGQNMGGPADPVARRAANEVWLPSSLA